MSLNLMSELQCLAIGTNPLALRRLVELGVSYRTIGEMGRNHFSFGVGKCLDVDDGLFVPSDEGRLQLVLPVYESLSLVDLVAFSTRRPHDWRLRLGQGWALGLEPSLEPYRWGEVLPLYSSPLDWMRANCEGVCVLDWAAPEVFQLTDFSDIRCEDARLAPLLRKTLSRPTRLPNITIGEGYQDAA